MIEDPIERALAMVAPPNPRPSLEAVAWTRDEAETALAHLRAVGDYLAEARRWLTKAAERARQTVGDEVADVIAELHADIAASEHDTLAPALAEWDEVVERLDASEHYKHGVGVRRPVLTRR